MTLDMMYDDMMTKPEDDETVLKIAITLCFQAV